MSNKIPCGGFYLDDTLNVNDNGELSIKGGTPYQQLVTDGDGKVKWEDKMVVDSELSATSTNPVQNKAIKSALDAKLEAPFSVTLTTNMKNWAITSDNSVDEVRTALRLGKDVKAVSKYTSGDLEVINGHSIYCVETGGGIAFLFVHFSSSGPSFTENIPYSISSIYMTDTNIISGSSDNQVPSLYTDQLCLRSKSGNKWFEISVDDSGTISATEVN